jgi:hypothetical protein
MTFGEYIDLDKYISAGRDAHKANGCTIQARYSLQKRYVSYRRVRGIDKYADLLRYMPTSIVLGAMVFFYRLGMKLSKHLIAVFNGDNAPDGVIKSREAVFGERWGWYQSIYALAGGDVTKFDQVTKDHYISV